MLLLDDNRFATTGLVTFRFGNFCAHRAQATRRNAWLWFFLGLVLAPFTRLALLYQNNQDRDRMSAGGGGA